MTWQDKITFLDAPSGVEHQVRGQNIMFYQMSPRMILQLRSISRPLSQALSILLRSKKSDSESIYRDFSDPKTGEAGTETIQRAVPLDTMEALLNKKERAIDLLIDSMSQEANLHLVIKIIFDACRDLFPRNPTERDINEFIDSKGVDTGTLSQFLVGVAKANLKTLGPLADRVSETFSAKLEEALEAPRNQQDEDQTQTELPTESPESGPPNPFQTPG